jgi:segregation and condensation protein B
MEQQQLKLVIEAALLAASEPLALTRLASLFDLDEQANHDEIHAVLRSLQEECADRSYELVEVASGWRFQVRPRFSQWVNKLWEEKPPKYSRATLETLALIAYRQPITRGDIEEVRGVAVSTHIIQSLMERNWVRIVGHRDVPGRPALYATTKQFLDYFNLKSLDQLPSLSELRDIESINKELPFEPSAENANDRLVNIDGVAENDEATLTDEEDEAASSMVTLFLPGG